LLYPAEGVNVADFAPVSFNLGHLHSKSWDLFISHRGQQSIGLCETNLVDYILRGHTWTFVGFDLNQVIYIILCQFTLFHPPRTSAHWFFKSFMPQASRRLLGLVGCCYSLYVQVLIT
jgi:hypothetical protein